MKNKRIGIVAGTFHSKEIELMKATVIEEAKKYNLDILTISEVPGCMEKPLALKWLFERDDIDGVAVIGIIEKGQTQHGLVMGNTVIDAILRLELEYNKPVGLGILGPGIEADQIEPRLIPYAKKAVNALVTMFELQNKI